MLSRMLVQDHWNRALGPSTVLTVGIDNLLDLEARSLAARGSDLDGYRRWSSRWPQRSPSHLDTGDDPLPGPFARATERQLIKGAERQRLWEWLAVMTDFRAWPPDRTAVGDLEPGSSAEQASAWLSQRGFHRVQVSSWLQVWMHPDGILADVVAEHWARITLYYVVDPIDANLLLPVIDIGRLVRCENDRTVLTGETTWTGRELGGSLAVTLAAIQALGRPVTWTTAVSPLTNSPMSTWLGGGAHTHSVDDHIHATIEVFAHPAVTAVLGTDAYQYME